MFLPVPRSRGLFPLALILAAAGLVEARADDSTPPPSSGVITRVLQPFLDSNSLPGAVVLVADKDKILDLEAVGYQDLATKKPMTTNSYFWIASMTKSFTAAAMMMLVQDGKLSIDDPVEKYLPEFAHRMVVDPNDPTHTPHPADRPFLIRELLSHTSGLPKHTDRPGPHPDDTPTLEERAHFYSLQTLDAQPGTVFNYTNLGPNLAGRIIEIASGMPYETFLQTRLLGPLGMTETKFIPTDEELTRLATCYQASPDLKSFVPANGMSFTYPLSNPKRQPLPCGGLFSTATDISKFCRMLLNGGTFQGRQYLTPESIRQMTIDRTPPGGKVHYGLGFDLEPNGAFGHAGGYQTYMEIDPQTNRTWVFMVQFFGNKWPHDGNKVRGAVKAAVARISAGSS